EEPLVAFFAVLQFDEDETAAELFAIENEFQLALLQLAFRVERAFDEKAAAIPDHDGSRAVAAFGDFSFEAAVFERMIFCLDGEAFVGSVKRGAFGYSPGFESAID